MGPIFVYALTYGGAVAALFAPWCGLLIYVCFAILKPEALWHWSVPEGNYSRIIAVAMLAGWAIQGFGSWRFSRGRVILLGLLGFWVWTVLGVTQARDTDIAWRMVESLSKVFLPFVVGFTLIDSLTKVKQLAWVIVLSEGYLAFEINLRYLAGGFNPEGFDHGSLDNNGIAITMVTCVGFAFFLGMHTSAWWKKALAFAAAAVMVHMVLFSMSRGGVLALIVTAAMAFFLVPKSPKHYVALVIGLLVVVRLAGPSVLERFETAFASAEARDRSARARFEYWTAAAEAIAQHPVLGVGPDQWKVVCPEYGIPLGRAVHSTWIQVAVEFGLVGLLCLALFYGGCVIRLIRVARTSTPVGNEWLRHLSRMVIVSLVGFVVSAQFVTMYGVDLPYYIVLVGAGVLKLSSSEEAELDGYLMRRFDGQVIAPVQP
jgi:probable O-glycosylation ligase (exosortase A-associated)